MDSISARVLHILRVEHGHAIGSEVAAIAIPDTDGNPDKLIAPPIVCRKERLSMLLPPDNHQTTYSLFKFINLYVDVSLPFSHSISIIKPSWI